MKVVKQVGRRLVLPLLTAILTVASGIAINAAFVSGRGLIWPWVLVAVALAVIQVKLSGPGHEDDQSDGIKAPLLSDRLDTAPQSSRRKAMIERLHELAADQVPARPIPIAWRAERSDYDPDANDDLCVGGHATVSEYYLNTASRRMVILGGPGSGKTILAWRLALDIAEKQNANERIPVVLSVGTWNPFNEDFQDWLSGELVTLDEEQENIDISEILPILDGFDEYSDQLRSQALAILSGRDLVALPVILISRPYEYKGFNLWRRLLTAAAIVELAPLPADAISSYLEELPRGDHGSPLDSIVHEVRSYPEESVAKALSSAFMLDIASKEYLQTAPGDFLHAAIRDSLARAQDVLALSFVRRMTYRSRWPYSDAIKWLRGIADRSIQPFGFRPNELEAPVLVHNFILLIAAALPAVALTLCLTSVRLWQTLVLAVGFGWSLMAFDIHTRPEPTIDPRDELRFERAAAAEKAKIAFAATTALGFPGIMALYIGAWVLGLGMLLGALLSALGARRTRERLIGSAVGGPFGAAMGGAAYVGTH